ncbi:MAG: hypothetical protein HC836_46030 [Richelia sp. RM2_1_2]|nr:hypothetical protein [Richelia sp. RM2_1_2]
MVWDILIQAAIGFVAGAAVGYGVSAVIEALSSTFADLWQGFISTAKAIFSYLTEATKYFLALVAQFLQDNWQEIEYYLRQELGYQNEWLITVFKYGVDIVVSFYNQNNLSAGSRIIKLQPIENQENIQLPTMQDEPIVATLSL